MATIDLETADPAAPPRLTIQRVGATVLQHLVEMIAIGRFGVGDYLPREQDLCDEFGVSRTVVRECMKRLQEKGMVTVAQGRGTQVMPFSDWNVLDPLVLSTLIRNDESLDVLDEVSTVRAALEGVMAGRVAAANEAEALVPIRRCIERMRASLHDETAFLEADAAFHLAVMEASQDRIAGNVARMLFVSARHTARYEGNAPATTLPMTLDEHEAVFAAFEAGDAEAARASMERHIIDAWNRRRLPSGRTQR